MLIEQFLWLLLALGLVQVVFKAFIALGLYKIRVREIKAISTNQSSGISVIIAARNEATILENLIKEISSQDFETFEIVVVNDGSDDNSSEILSRLKNDYSCLTVVELEKSVGKKNAVSEGIKHAQYERLTFTDADCLPIDRQWIRKMSQSFGEGAEFIIGTGLFYPRNSNVNVLYRTESIRVAMLCFGMAALGMPYMAVGRSMAYLKSVFNKVDGFKGHEHIKSGDDDLFLQSLPNSIKIALRPDAVTFSESPYTYMEWIRQRKRHFSAGSQYKLTHKIWLWTNELSWLALIIAISLCLIDFNLIPTIILLLELSLLLIINFLLIKRFDQLTELKSHNLKLFPFFWLLTLVNPIISVASQLQPPTGWKRSI